MKTVCYHHNDNDGKAAGYIVYNNTGGVLTDYHSTSYNDAMNYDVTGADVYIVDISFVSNTIHKLYDILDGKYGKPASVVWIDHHKGSLDDIINNPEHYVKLRSYDNFVSMVFDGFCGAMLTYLYFGIVRKDNTDFIHNPKLIDIAYKKPNTDLHWQHYGHIIQLKWTDGSMEFIVPEWLVYIDDYDCWKKTMLHTDKFILGLDANDTRLWSMTAGPIGAEPTLNPVWWSIKDRVDELIDNGCIIHNYRESTNARNLFARFEIMIDGKKCLAMNARGNSFVFCDYIHQYPCCVVYFYDGKAKNWSMTFYSSDKAEDRMDCCAIAKRFGGGGHMGAAGCTVDKPAHEIFKVV